MGAVRGAAGNVILHIASAFSFASNMGREATQHTTAAALIADLPACWMPRGRFGHDICQMGVPDRLRAFRRLERGKLRHWLGVQKHFDLAQNQCFGSITETLLC